MIIIECLGNYEFDLTFLYRIMDGHMNTIKIKTQTRVFLLLSYKNFPSLAIFAF